VPVMHWRGWNELTPGTCRGTRRERNVYVSEILKLIKVGIVCIIFYWPKANVAGGKRLGEERLLETKVFWVIFGIKSCTMSRRERKAAARGCVVSRTSSLKSLRGLHLTRFRLYMFRQEFYQSSFILVTKIPGCSMCSFF